MLTPARPIDEEYRLKKLKSYQVLDTASESCFDDIANLARQICSTQFALISLIDEKRQWFKSRRGIEVIETSREISFCGHAILSDDVLVIPDTHLDARFCDNPLVLDGPMLRFYAGAPLISPEGLRIGTLCVLDSRVMSLSESQAKSLQTLATHVVSLFELKVRNLELSTISSQSAAIQSMSKTGGWELNVKTLGVESSHGVSAIFNVPPHQEMTLEEAFTYFPVRDRFQLRDLITRCIHDGQNFEGEFELRDAVGKHKWVGVKGRANLNEQGRVDKIIGTLQDITDRVSFQYELMQQNAEIEAYARGLDRYAIVAKTDTNGIITYANDNFCDISGYTREELIGADHIILSSGLHPKGFFAKMWQSIKKGEQWRGEICNRAKDGSLYWVDTTITPSFDPRSGEIQEFIAFRYDITANKKVEEKLRESEERYRLIFDQSVDSMLTISIVDWSFTACNQATLNLFGLHSKKALLHRYPWEFSPKLQPSGPESKLELSRKLTTVLEEGSSFFEWVFEDASGSLIECTILLNKVVLGNETFIHGVIRDISSQKRAEREIEQKNKELTDSKTYLDLALAGANLGIWDWFLENDTVWFDRRWAEMLGIEYEGMEMLLDTWKSRVNVDDLAECYRGIEACLQGERAFFESVYRMMHADGKWRYIFARARVSEWDEQGKAVRLTGTHFDLTEQKQREIINLDISEMRAKYIEHTSEPKKFFDYLLAKLGSIIRSERGFFYSLDKSQKQAVITSSQLDSKECERLVTLAEKVKWRESIQIIDGNKVGIALKHKGHVIGLIVLCSNDASRDYAVLQDYLPLISAAEQIEHSYTMEQRLEEQTQIAMHSSRLAAIGQLAAGVGHEINNPTAIVVGMVSMIERNLREINFKGDKVFDYLSRIKNASTRITSIVKGLRTFARSDESQIDVFDLNQLLRDTIEMLCDIYRNDGVELRFKAMNEEAIWRGNRGRIQQLIVNLLSNAKDATTTKDDRAVWAEIERNKDGEFVIRVSDNGCGVSEQARERLFDPFFTTKPVNQGTGIGLALVSAIVKEHQGKIAFESEIGMGTTFIVSLPATAEEELLHFHTTKERPTSGLGQKIDKTILVVDDETDLCVALQSLMQGLAKGVLAASSAIEAMTILETQQIDLIISDINMPGIDGIEFLKNVLEVMQEKSPKLILMSGRVELDQGQSDFIKEHCSGFMTKPFSEETIYELLLRIFHNHE